MPYSFSRSILDWDNRDSNGGIIDCKTLRYIQKLPSWFPDGYFKFFRESTLPLMSGRNSPLLRYPNNLPYGSYCTGFRWFSEMLKTHCWRTELLDPNDKSVLTLILHSWSPYLKHLLPVALIHRPMDQPMTFWWNKSNVTAKYNQPSKVGIYVISDTQYGLAWKHQIAGAIGSQLSEKNALGLSSP